MFSCVLLNFVAAWSLNRHWVPKSMDWNLCSSLHSSVFLTPSYESSSSSKKRPAVVCKVFLHLPEAHGDSPASLALWLQSHSFAPAMPRLGHPRAVLTLPHDMGAGFSLVLTYGFPHRAPSSPSLLKFPWPVSLESRWRVWPFHHRAQCHYCLCYSAKCILTIFEKTLAVTGLFSTVFTPTALLRLLLKSSI